MEKDALPSVGVELEPVTPKNIEQGSILRLYLKDAPEGKISVAGEYMVTIIQAPDNSNDSTTITISRIDSGGEASKIYTLISTGNESSTWKYKNKDRTYYLDVIRCSSQNPHGYLIRSTGLGVVDVLDKTKVVSVQTQEGLTINVELRNIGDITLAGAISNHGGLPCHISIGGVTYDGSIKFFPTTGTCMISYATGDNKKVRINATYKKESL